MSAINLLPKDLTPKEGVVKIASLIKRMTIIGFIALVISIVALVGGNFYIEDQIKMATMRQDNLKTEISALEQTEVRLVLVKDRLAKVDEIFSTNSAADEVVSFRSLLELFPEGVNLAQVQLNDSSTTLTISAQNSSSLSEFLAALLSSGIYSNVQLVFLEYSQIAGNYSVGLIFGG